mgnify:CR=1 FL=1
MQSSCQSCQLELCAGTHHDMTWERWVAVAWKWKQKWKFHLLMKLPGICNNFTFKFKYSKWLINLNITDLLKLCSHHNLLIIMHTKSNWFLKGMKLHNQSMKTSKLMIPLTNSLSFAAWSVFQFCHPMNNNMFVKSVWRKWKAYVNIPKIPLLPFISS